MADLFNNPSNDYIVPGLSPCPNAADDQYLVWDKNGLSIIKGSDIVSNIDYSDLSIPVNSFNKQQLVLASGEVAYIQGLTKGLCQRVQGFSLPSLISTDEDLNPYFFQIDLSVNYYKNFSFTYSNIDVSANYGSNINIQTALSIAFSNAGIKIEASYDPSTIYFTGTQAGYDFEISNVNLTIFDTSDSSISPFAYGVNAQTYDLEEDASVEIPYAKYPNTAMQGIALKGIYTSDVYDEDRWIYLNHVSDYLVTCDPINVNYDSEVSTGIAIYYDLSTYLGVYPSFSIGDVSALDSSGLIITDSSIKDSTLYDSSIYTSFIDNTILYTSYIENSYVGNSLLVESPIVGSSIITSTIDNNDVSINNSTIWDSSIYNGEIYDSSLFRTYLEGVNLYGCTLYNCSYDASVSVLGNREILIDASIEGIFEVISDTSTFYLKHRKKIEVGMSGCSVGELISAGDYLNFVSVNGMWKKVGDVYIWTTATDPTSCTEKNLIEGFYVFNPHEFSVKIEYLVFV